jgi:hypothetical protein
MYQPFARPISRRPAYKPAILVVAIMITLETQQRAEAIHKHCLRPSQVANIPAVDELRKAPKVISDDISC